MCRPLGGVDGVSGASTRNLSIKATVAPVCHQHLSLSNNLCSRCSRWHLIRALRWRTRANVTTIECDHWSPMDTVQPSFNMPEPLSIGRSLIMTLEQFKSCISTCLKLFSSLNIFSHSIWVPSILRLWDVGGFFCWGWWRLWVVGCCRFFVEVGPN